MDKDELKFLLKLLGCENYRSTLSGKVFKSFKSKNAVCERLGDRDIIDYSREIANVKILPPGKALLELDAAEIPIEDKELKILENVGKAAGKVAPSKIKSSLKAAQKEEILKKLSDRGLVETQIKLKRTKAEVWLTERGIELLRDDFVPENNYRKTISLDLLNNYLRFLRKTLQNKSEQAGINTESAVEITNITDEDILEIILKLDKELGTENYLPIFHLRQKLQPPLSRDDLDKALYRLQADDKIDLGTLQEASAYTPAQIDTGIVQNAGGPLFYISIE